MASLILLTEWMPFNAVWPVLLPKHRPVSRCCKRIWTCRICITLNLERAVQVCVDIAAHVVAEFNSPAPATMAESFNRPQGLGVITEETALRMKNAVGFRNISVQEYQKIDWLIVFRIITEHLDDFKNFARQVLAWSNGSKFRNG